MPSQRYHQKRKDKPAKSWQRVNLLTIQNKDATFEVLKLEVALRHRWDLRRYRQGSHERPDDESDISGDEAELRGRGRSEVVDMAIRDRKWWSYLRILEHLASVLRKLQHWAEWCPCHSDLVIQLEGMAALDDAEKDKIRRNKTRKHKLVSQYNTRSNT